MFVLLLVWKYFIFVWSIIPIWYVLSQKYISDCVCVCVRVCVCVYEHKEQSSSKCHDRGIKDKEKK